MTLLERWDLRLTSRGAQYISDEEIRRAIAIAQAVDEIDKENFGSLSAVYRRADELLAAKEQQP